MYFFQKLWYLSDNCIVVYNFKTNIQISCHDLTVGFELGWYSIGFAAYLIIWVSNVTIQ